MESKLTVYLNSGVCIEDDVIFSDEVTSDLKEQFITQFKKDIKDRMRNNSHGVIAFGGWSIRVSQIAAYRFD